MLLTDRETPKSCHGPQGGRGGEWPSPDTLPGKGLLPAGPWLTGSAEPGAHEGDSSPPVRGEGTRASPRYQRRQPRLVTTIPP